MIFFLSSRALSLSPSMKRDTMRMKRVGPELERYPKCPFPIQGIDLSQGRKEKGRKTTVTTDGEGSGCFFGVAEGK
jgi:hypothetical protein